MMRFPARIARDGFGFREFLAGLPTAMAGLSTYGEDLAVAVNAFTTAMQFRLDERWNVPALPVPQVGIGFPARVSVTVRSAITRLRRESRPPHRRRHD